jgi:CMP-N,N'-diacetyllegionaminic acid synthase
MKVIAIIPARGGSKGVPGKNRKLILGKPLINYTVETALKSKLLSDIWVTTDDNFIMECVNKFDNILLHKRDKKLATDNSPITETVKAILNSYHVDDLPDAVMLLQPTSPIRETSDIDLAIKELKSRESVNSVISVCEMDDIHPARMYWKSEDVLIPIIGQYESVRRQDIPKALYRNGSIYLTRTISFLSTGSLMCKPSFGYVMPERMLLNIDSPRDMLIAPVLIKAWRNGELS